MVSNHTEHSFMVVCSLLRVELYYDPGLRVGQDCSFKFGERENVRFVREELEGGGLVALVDDVQKSVGCASLLNFSKVDRFV